MSTRLDNKIKAAVASFFISQQNSLRIKQDLLLSIPQPPSLPNNYAHMKTGDLRQGMMVTASGSGLTGVTFQARADPTHPILTGHPDRLTAIMPDEFDQWLADRVPLLEQHVQNALQG